MIVAVGTANLIKLEAARIAFERLWPERDVDVISRPVPSGGPDQPMSDHEALHGARARAGNALNAGQADFGVGLEGGLSLIDGRWFDCGWCVIFDRAGTEGVGTTLRLPVPPKVMELVQEGKELGAAGDAVFGTVNSKSAGGFFGLVTDGALDRAVTYSHAVLAALSVFLHPNLWNSPA